MKKGMKRAFAVALAVMLAGSGPVFSVSAAEIDENNSEITAPAEESEAKVTGKRETLKCSDVSRDLDWGFFNETEGSTDWYGRMAFPEYASSLYFTLADESVWLNDSNFSEETAFRVSYDGKEDDVFNAVTVLDMSGVARMSDEEWEEIKENISHAYIAVKRDYPGMFWLKEEPKVTRVAASWTDETGEEVYSYQVYFLLKNYNRDYDIRSAKYRSAEAIQAVMAEREQSVQAALGAAAGMDAAGMITYFYDNYKSVAKSMGLGKDNGLYAFKLLCDRAGIPCVLAAGGGSMESFVSLDGAWYEPVEVKDLAEEQKREEEKKAEEAAKKAEEEAEAAKKDVKTEKGKAAKKARSSETASAGPAFQSEVPVMATSAGGMQPRAGLAIQFFVDGSSTATDPNSSAFKDILVTKKTPNDQNPQGMNIFGNTFGSMIDVLGTTDRITAQVNGKEVSNLSFALDRADVRPSAGTGKEYAVRCYGTVVVEENGATKEVNVDEEVFKDTIDVQELALNVSIKQFEYFRYYKGTTSADFRPKSGSAVVPVANAVSGFPVTVTATPIVTGDNAIVEISEYQGTVKVRLNLTGTGALNYTLGAQGGAREDTLTIEEGVPYSVDARPLTLNQINIDELSPADYYIYNGQAKRPDIRVTAYTGEELIQDVDYIVDYRNNIDATDGAEIVITNATGGRKFKWEGEKVKKFTIRKADWTVDPIDPLTVKCGKEDKFSLLSLIPDDAEIYYAEAASESDSVFDANFKIEPVDERKAVAYKIKEDPSVIGKQGVVNIVVNESKNYNGFSVKLYLNIVGKDPRKNFRFEHDVIKMTEGEVREILVLDEELEGTDITYKGDKASVAIVDKDGNVEAMSEGEVTITATVSENGDYEAAEATCKVIVVPEGHDVQFYPEEGFQAGGSEWYKLEIEKGISQIPAGLDYSKASEIEKDLKSELKKCNSKIPDENMAFYDIVLMTKKEESGWEWTVIEEEEDFPEGGLPITIPFPEGTDGISYDFTVVHMFTKDMNEFEAGEMENPKVTKRDNGLQFTVNGLSPIAVGWTEAENPANPEDPTTDPDDPNNPNNPNNPTDQIKQNNTTSTNNNQGTTGRSATGTGTGTGTTAGKSTTSTGALTGDQNRILLYAVLLAAAALTIGTVCVRRKKRK